MELGLRPDGGVPPAVAEQRGLADELARPELLHHLSLNMFCQYIYLWMYVLPAAHLHRWTTLPAWSGKKTSAVPCVMKYIEYPISPWAARRWRV